MKKFNSNQWFVIATIFAFLAFLAYFNIGSQWAEEMDCNGKITIAGIISIFLMGVSLIKAKDVSNN